jgi:acetoacetyl-CoA reductase
MENSKNAANNRLTFVAGGVGGLCEPIQNHLTATGMRVVTTYSPHDDHSNQWLFNQQYGGFLFRPYSVEVSNYDSCVGCVALDDWQAVVHSALDSIFNATNQAPH